MECEIQKSKAQFLTRTQEITLKNIFYYFTPELKLTIFLILLVRILC